MTIFADQCVNRDVIAALRNKGFKVTSTYDTKLIAAADNVIFNYILIHNCILLTFDKDFGNITRFDIKSSAGVVVVYIEDTGKEEIIDCALNFFNNFSPSKIKGRLFIIEKSRIRIWPR